MEIVHPHQFTPKKITVSNTASLKVLCPSDREIKVYNSSCAASVSLPYPLSVGLCPSGRVFYKINEGNTVRWVDENAKNITLPAGFHKITYLITDCEGNSTSCVWFISVKDFYAPEISCSADKTAVVPTGECIAPVPLPRPSISTDNCSQNFLYQQKKMHWIVALPCPFLVMFSSLSPSLSTMCLLLRKTV